MSFVTMFDKDLARFRAAQEALQELGTSNSKLDAQIRELEKQQMLHAQALKAERDFKRRNSMAHKFTKKLTGLRKETESEVVEENLVSSD